MNFHKARSTQSQPQSQQSVYRVKKKFQAIIHFNNIARKIIENTRRSIGKNGNTVKLLRYNNHITYVKNIENFFKCFRCPTCDTFFNLSQNLYDAKTESTLWQTWNYWWRKIKLKCDQSFWKLKIISKSGYTRFSASLLNDVVSVRVKQESTMTNVSKMRKKQTHPLTFSGSKKSID